MLRNPANAVVVRLESHFYDDVPPEQLSQIIGCAKELSGLWACRAQADVEEIAKATILRVVNNDEALRNRAIKSGMDWNGTRMADLY